MGQLVWIMIVEIEAPNRNYKDTILFNIKSCFTSDGSSWSDEVTGNNPGKVMFVLFFSHLFKIYLHEFATEAYYRGNFNCYCCSKIPRSRKVVFLILCIVTILVSALGIFEVFTNESMKCT